jgi:AcrR family transcriptional regulator
MTTAPETAGTAKPRLDRETIIAAGLELAAVAGTTSISVRDLGARLGSDPTAIYRHFRSKDDLMSALLDELTIRAIAEVDEDPADWEGRLRHLARSTLSWLSRFPAIGAEAIVLTTHGPGEHAAIELMLDAFRRAGLEGDDVVRHYALLASHTLASAAGIARARAEHGDHPDGGSPWFDEPVLVDPRRFPLIAEHSGRLADLQDTDLYFLGVDLIIDSARRTAARER